MTHGQKRVGKKYTSLHLQSVLRGGAGKRGKGAIGRFQKEEAGPKARTR